MPKSRFRHALETAAIIFLAGIAAAPCGAVDQSASDAAPLNLGALRGKVVYLDFWASWCGPCAQSFPWMDGMQQQFGNDGFLVIAVNVDRNRSDADAFLSKHPVDFQIVYDAAGKYAEQLGVHNMPTSFLIDRNGKVRMQHAGFRTTDRSALEHEIRDLLRSN